MNSQKPLTAALVLAAWQLTACVDDLNVKVKQTPDGGVDAATSSGGSGAGGTGAGAAGNGKGGATGGATNPGSGGTGAGGVRGSGGAQGPDATAGGGSAAGPGGGELDGGRADTGPGCAAETDPQFCERLHSTCGDVMAPDNCGTTRTATCGTCTGQDKCGAGHTCVPPGCTPETNAAYCMRLGKNCSVFSGYDNCGVGRSTNCGTCASPNTCATDNTCVCVAESDTAFCSRLGKDCGSVMAADNCGKSRTASCGSCTSPKTCGSNNVCACVAESGSTFCSRLGKDCGSVMAADNCGSSRTVACGTCGSTESCGNKNVCVVPLACTGRNDPVTVTFFDFTGSTPPTPAGGTLVDGYYTSTKISAYGSVDSAIGGSLEIRSGFIRRVHTTYNKAGSALTGWTEQGTYTTSGTNLTVNVTNCNFGGSGPQTLVYTAGPSQIRLFDTIQGQTVVTQYDLQP